MNGELQKKLLAIKLQAIKANCEMLETEDDPFLRRVFASAILELAMQVNRMVDDQPTVDMTVLDELNDYKR